MVARQRQFPSSPRLYYTTCITRPFLHIYTATTTLYMYVMYTGENVPLKRVQCSMCDGKRFVILINAARPESDGCKVR